jgi:hypothetical protein
MEPSSKSAAAMSPAKMLLKLCALRRRAEQTEVLISVLKGQIGQQLKGLAELAQTQADESSPQSVNLPNDTIDPVASDRIGTKVE